MQAGDGLLILDVMPIWWPLPWYRHDYLKFYQLPNSNLFTHRCYFSQEKPLVKHTAPGSLLYYICLYGLFLYAFIFRSINPKTQKYLAEIFYYLFYFMFSIYPIYYEFIYLFTREGLTTPLTRRVASICSLSAGTVYIVLHGSPTGSITLVSSPREMPIIVVLHHPFLFGEIPT